MRIRKSSIVTVSLHVKCVSQHVSEALRYSSIRRTVVKDTCLLLQMM